MRSAVGELVLVVLVSDVTVTSAISSDCLIMHRNLMQQITIFLLICHLNNTNFERKYITMCSDIDTCCSMTVGFSKYTFRTCCTNFLIRFFTIFNGRKGVGQWGAERRWAHERFSSAGKCYSFVGDLWLACELLTSHGTYIEVWNLSWFRPSDAGCLGISNMQ